MRVDELQAELLAISAKAAASGLSQLDIARAVHATQPQVSRILNGRVRRRTALVERVCAYVNKCSGHDNHAAVVRSPELLNSILEVWDGTAEHLDAIAAVIRSLAGLRPVRRSATDGRR